MSILSKFQLSRASESKTVTWKPFSIVAATQFTEQLKQLCAWKQIDLVVILPRSLYYFFSDQKEGYWSHMELIHFWNGSPGSTGWFFTLASSHACTIQNSPNSNDIFVSTKKLWNFRKNKLNPKFLGSFHEKISSQ